MSWWKKTIKDITGEKRLSKQLEISIDADFENGARLLIANMLEGYFPITSWSMRPSMIVTILNDILINKRKSIIEFGSGVSTICIALLIKKYQLNIDFKIVEHDQYWCSLVEKYLKEVDAWSCVDMHLCALEDGVGSWYKLSEGILNNNDNDMIIVDGPPSSNGRLGFLEFISSQSTTNKDVVIIIDDTKRGVEKEMALKICQDKNMKMIDYGRSSILCPQEYIKRQRNLLYG